MALAVFSAEGELLSKIVIKLPRSKVKETGSFITSNISIVLKSASEAGDSIESIGISVPGIYRLNKGTVWAPNIPDWDDYPLLNEVKKVTGSIPVTIDSDRACYILGELWKGNARGCNDAIYMAVGTGIGVGILTEGKVLRGAHDIAGAIGWMALNKPFRDEFVSCGCFEYNASGEGIAKVARDLLQADKTYKGELSFKHRETITSHDVFAAYENDDPIAKKVIQQAIEYWGMAVANLVSLFNPEKIILGGGVFGPAVKFIPAIIGEAARWAQPISITQVSIEPSGLGTDAGVYGAGYLALKTNPNHNSI